MSRPLASLEHLLERLIERPIGQLFGVRLEAVRLQRRLERVMGEQRRGRGRQTFVPDRYRVLLNPGDLTALLVAHPHLESEVAEALAVHARARSWTLAARPRVTVRPNAAVAVGDAVVETHGPDLDQAQADAFDAPAFEATAVLPVAAGPRALLIARSPGAPERRLVVEQEPVRLGRADDNDLVLADGRVSRHHGILSPGHGTLIYRDLDSANGTFLGSTRVGEVALGVGDVLRLGDSTVRIERA
ncbi:MAG: FhaA domain-containing protein [Candidatus Limnocylindrales bacterium]